MTAKLDVMATALKAWWTGITVKGAALQAVMEDEKRPFVSPQTKAIAILKLSTITPRGHDEVHWEESEDDPLTLDATVRGQRRLLVTCRVDSFSQVIAETALYYAERARTRLMMPKTRAALRAAGMALVETTPVVHLPFEVNERVFSRAAFDVAFSIVATETTEPVDAQDTIGTVEIRSNNLVGPDGSPISPQVETTVSEP
jgi:hypothetical protein